MHARFATRPPDVSARRVAASQALRVVTLGVASSAVLVGCGTPGVRGVAGTAPAPSVRWTPPAPSQPAAPLPAPPQLPPDLTGRIAQLKLTDVIDIALRNNTATSAAWADARAAAATYGAAKGQYYPTIVLAVEQAYFLYLGTKGLLDAQQTTLKEAETNLDAAQQRHRVGLATIADVLQARTALSQARLALEATQGELQTTRGALALSMGLPANVPYDIEVVPDTTTPFGVVEGVDSLIARAMRERPDLAAQRAQVEQARARVSVARSQALPTLSVGGTGSQTYFFQHPGTVTPPAGNSYNATLTLSIPLFSGWSQIYNVKAATAAAEAAARRAQGFEQQVVYQVFNAYYGLRTATQQVRTSRDLLASATESEQVALGRYKAGAGSLLDLLTAQAALASARAQAIQARLSWNTALAQLAHDVGILGLDGSSPLQLQTDTTGTPK